MKYIEIFDYAVSNIKRDKDFYIDVTDLNKKARLHIYVRNIVDSEWYFVEPEIFNGKSYIVDSRLSANTLDDFRRCVGVAYQRLSLSGLS